MIVAGQKKGMDEEQKIRYKISDMQRLLAKNAGDYLVQNMDRHVTIEELAGRFYVSPTLLKKSFKKLYGVSVYAYSRRQKMRSAAYMLRSTNDTIMQIAGRYGYENPSKFAKAFKDIMGVSPNAYRSQMNIVCPNGVDRK